VAVGTELTDLHTLPSVNMGTWKWMRVEVGGKGRRTLLTTSLE
jgi:hypothetical protein